MRVGWGWQGVRWRVGGQAGRQSCSWQGTDSSGGDKQRCTDAQAAVLAVRAGGPASPHPVPPAPPLLIFSLLQVIKRANDNNFMRLSRNSLTQLPALPLLPIPCPAGHQACQRQRVWAGQRHHLQGHQLHQHCLPLAQGRHRLGQVSSAWGGGVMDGLGRGCRRSGWGGEGAVGAAAQAAACTALNHCANVAPPGNPTKHDVSYALFDPFNF